MSDGTLKLLFRKPMGDINLYIKTMVNIILLTILQCLVRTCNSVKLSHLNTVEKVVVQLHKKCVTAFELFKTNLFSYLK